MPRAENAVTMSNAAFRCWRDAMGFTMQQAADALGLSSSRIDTMERGTKRGSDQVTTIPGLMAFACAAVHAGLDPYAWDDERGVMPAEDFVRWLAEMGEKRGLARPLQFQEAAELLLLNNVETPAFWAKGIRRDKKPAPIHRDRALAMSALLHGLKPWTREK